MIQRYYFNAYKLKYTLFVVITKNETFILYFNHFFSSDFIKSTLGRGKITDTGEHFQLANVNIYYI